MNWARFLWVVVSVGWFVELIIAISYENWKYPEYHEVQRNWMWLLLVTLTLLTATLVGVSS